MLRPRISVALARLGLGSVLGLGLACGPRSLSESGEDSEATTQPESDSDESESEESGETGEGFDPHTCGSWDPPAATAPASPPAEQLCPEDGPCPVFTEIAEEVGLGTQQYVPTHPADLNCIFPRPTGDNLVPFLDCEPGWFTGGATIGDVDRDGWPDIYMTRLAAPDHLFRNRGDGTFEDVAAELGLGECSYTNGAVFGDIDNDGDLDLLVTTVGEDRYKLWLNQLAETGTVSFVDEAEERGFAMSSSHVHSGESVTLGDYDRDGWLDVHVNEWLRVEQMPELADPFSQVHGGRLLRNLGGGSFEDRTLASGVDLHGLDEDGIFAYSSTFADLDGDGWQDLAIAVDFHRSRLFWNLGGLAFLDGSSSARINRESNAMGSTFADADLDGDFDWFVTSIAELDDMCEDGEEPPCWSGSGNRLYSYAGAREYELVTDEAGVRDGAWAWGTSFFDADNDGDQDLVLGNGWPGRDLNGGFYHADTPTRLWINDGSGVMSEEGEARGVFDKNQGRSIVAFDYDRDGDLDLLLTNHAGAPRLFRNEGGNQNAWLRIELEGVISNRDARGAKVRVQVEPEGPWQIREVGVGSHFLGEGELIQHFGLGPDFDLELDRVYRVEIEWPASGRVQSFDELEGGQTLTVVEE